MTRETIPRPSPPPAAPPTQPAKVSPDAAVQPNRGWLFAAAGCAAVSLLLGLGGLAAFWLFSPPATTGSGPTTEANTDAEIIDGLAGQVQVELESGEATVQWIRLKDDTENTLIHARPDGSGQVLAGEYTLVVKVMARPALGKQISITEDTKLRCKPATMGQVKCMRGSSLPPIVLKP